MNSTCTRTVSLCPEQVSTKIPLARMDEKYSRVLQYCEKEVEHILRLFRRQKDDPPLPRNFPPIAGKHGSAHGSPPIPTHSADRAVLKLSSAGRIKWARSLNSHLEELVQGVSQHPVLKTLHATAELVRKYNHVSNTLHNYESEMINAWLNHNVSNKNGGACSLVLPFRA